MLAEHQETAPRIVLVDGGPIARQLLVGPLADAGYGVTLVRSLHEAFVEIQRVPADVLVLDASDLNGVAIEAARMLRERTDTPIVAVGGPDEREPRLAAYVAGVDDYLPGSPHPREVEVRIAALLRRARRIEGPRSVLEGPESLVMRVRAHEVRMNGELLDLTPKEFAVLRLLLEHRGDVVRTEELSQQVWGYSTFGQRNFVEAHISRLRQKLREQHPSDVITTIRGVGYKVPRGA